MPQITSPIWDYFEKIEDNKIKCKICSLKLSKKRKKTSTHRKHLETKHPKTSKELEEKKQAIVINSGNSFILKCLYFDFVKETLEKSTGVNTGSTIHEPVAKKKKEKSTNDDWANFFVDESSESEEEAPDSDIGKVSSMLGEIRYSQFVLIIYLVEILNYAVYVLIHSGNHNLSGTEAHFYRRK